MYAERWRNRGKRWKTGGGEEKEDRIGKKTEKILFPLFLFLFFLFSLGFSLKQINLIHLMREKHNLNETKSFQIRTSEDSHSDIPTVSDGKDRGEPLDDRG